MDTFWQDLRYSARMLRRTPGFALIAVLSLALGIGATTTIFSVIYTYILRPLPYQDQGRIVILWESYPSKGDLRNAAATANFVDWQKATDVFERMGMFGSGEPVTVTAPGLPEKATREFVTPELFQLLGAKPALGRVFDVEDVRQNRRSLVISHAYWKRRFGGDPNVIGQTLTIPGTIAVGSLHTIIGVMPANFYLLDEDRVDVWQPLNLESGNAVNRQVRWLLAAARLKPGVTLAQAQAQMTTIASRLEREYPENKGWTVTVERIGDAFSQGAKEALYPLFGAVAFVLLIACTNVANLLLSRAVTRQREIAIRAALGASRLRLVRQLLMDGILLALPAGLLGLLAASWGIDLFVAAAPAGIPFLQEISINRIVLGFTLLLSVATGIGLGLAPALQGSRPNVNESLKAAGSRQVASSGGRLRGLLVVTEIGLALVLLVGAGLMITTMWRLLRVDPGFDRRNVLAMQFNLSGPNYVQMAPKREIDMRTIRPQASAFYQQLLERVRALPGVECAGLASILPLSGWRQRSFSIAGRAEPPVAERPTAAYNLVSSDYLHALRVPLLKGRFLMEQDNEQAPWAVVVNDALARRYFPNEDPIGQLITMNVVREERPRQIVGVVGNVRQYSRLSREPRPEIYASFRQQPEAYPGDGAQSRLSMTLLIRTASDRAALTAAVRKLAAEIDKEQPVYQVRTMEEILAGSVAFDRFYMSLLAVFAAVALVLAAIGIYGVMSYTVNERTHEIGIRMALGAGPTAVLRLVLGQGLKLTLLGLALGLVASFAATRVLANLFYGVKPTDPATFAAVSLLLAAIALLAAYKPARRAARIDPLVTLRSE